MKKTDADQTALPDLTTTYTEFCFCDEGESPLFAVCDGVEMKHALEQLMSLLRLAHENNYQASEIAEGRLAKMVLATQHSLEASKAIVASLLKSIERQATPG
ncbi:DUF3077 domain-containing protein [Pseudomonas wadenswilerensis]